MKQERATLDADEEPIQCFQRVNEALVTSPNGVGGLGVDDRSDAHSELHGLSPKASALFARILSRGWSLSRFRWFGRSNLQGVAVPTTVGFAAVVSKGT